MKNKKGGNYIMRIVEFLAKVNIEKCKGCKTCEKVCPVFAIKVIDKKAIVSEDDCLGCANCEQRCPFYAMTMAKRETPFRVGVNPNEVDQDKLLELCHKAKFNPEQVLCYCIGTRADEIAAAIIKGAKTPADITKMTGARTGCKVECIEPILRLLEAAGIKLEKALGYQWYGRTVTAWEISEEVKQKYNNNGYHFDDDKNLLEKVCKIKK